MTLLTFKDFTTKSGQEKIIKTIHRLEAKLHELEAECEALKQAETRIEHELQGPEAY